MHLTQHLTRTLTLGLPLVGSQVAQILIGITDTAMLGRYSVEALAAGTLGHTVFFTMFSLAMGFGLAVMGIAADASGRDDERAVRRAARMGIWLSVLAGLAVMPLMIWSAPVLRALGQGEDLALDAQAYLRIAGFGMIPILVMVTIRSHLSALEHTRIVLWATLAAAALNVAMNWILIFGNLGAPELGIRGAAIASVGVQVAMMLFLIVYAMRGPDMARWELFRNLHQPDWPVFKRVAAIGMPIGLTQLAETGLFAASALMMGWISTEALAAHGIAIQVAAATFMMHMGLSQAATVRVGRFAGRGDALGLRRASLAALILSGIAVVGSMIAYFTAGGWIVQLFLDANDPQAPEILELGRRLLIMAALFQLVDAGQVMAQGFLRGLQDTRVPMVYAILSYWGVGIPASYALGFPLGWGGEGIWLGLSIGLAVAAVTLLARFWRLAPRVTPEAASVF